MTDAIHSFDQGLADVIIEAYRFGFSVKSNFARERAEHVAMAASMGLVTTKLFGNVYSRHWRPTVDGLKFLQTLDYADLPDA